MAHATGRDDLRDDCLARLRELAFVRAAAIQGRGSDGEASETLVLDTPAGRRELRLLEVRSHLTEATARWLAARASGARGPAILFAPQVSRAMGRRLADAGLHYVDRAGNCSLLLGGGLIAQVEGRRARPAAAAPGRTLRAPALQVLLAWLARPDLLNAPVREVAGAAGVSRSTVSNLRRQLESEGAIVRTAAGLALPRPEALRERWIAAYSTTLRPRLLLGRYEVAATDPLERERRIEEILLRGEAAGDWAWGGGTAAYRLTGHWHGEGTTLHVAGPPADLLAALGALPARAGRLVILGAPGPVGLEGPLPRVAHPLVVVAELLSLDDDRASEAAAEVIARHLEGGPTA